MTSPVLLLLSLLTSCLALSCRDEAGQEVDWWILYKLPKQASAHVRGHRGFLGEGLAYAYLTSSLSDTSWTLSDLPIDDPKSIPGQTLAPLYSDTASMFHVMYNDEHPEGPTSFTKGHTKGLVLGDRDQGSVWLIHSVPHYPPYPNQTYGYPHTGQRYGQTFICLSTSTDSLEPIGTQLWYNDPYIYSVNTPDWMSAFPSMVKAATGKHVGNAPYFHTTQLTSQAGVLFTSFAKFTKWNKDLYADLVAPSLRVPLAVETWPNGPGKMPSRCNGPFIVENIDEMEFLEIEDDDFTTKHDHAKWAISLDSKQPYVCVGDINRMDTQKHRAGGTLCFVNKPVWKTFKSTIKVMEECPRSRKFTKKPIKPFFWKRYTKKFKFSGTFN